MTNNIETLQAVVNDLVLDKPQDLTMLDRYALVILSGLMPLFVKQDPTAPNRRHWADGVFNLAESMLKERARRLQKKG